MSYIIQIFVDTLIGLRTLTCMFVYYYLEGSLASRYAFKFVYKERYISYDQFASRYSQGHMGRDRAFAFLLLRRDSLVFMLR